MIKYSINKIFSEKRLLYLKANQSKLKFFKNYPFNPLNKTPLQAKIFDLYIAETEGCGLGLFTNEAIPKGACIGEYVGIVEKGDRKYSFKNIFNRRALATDYCWNFPFNLNFFTPLQINAETAGNELRFVNHSFAPNLIDEICNYEGEHKVLFITTRDILANEELLIDYGDDYWNHPSRQIHISQKTLELLTVQRNPTPPIFQ